MTDPYAELGTRRPDVRAGRRDAHDVRVGETLGQTSGDLDAARVVLLGCPQDEGVRRNRGRPGAARGPGEIRHAFYGLSINGIEGLALFDAGDVPPAETLEETHQRLHAAAAALLARGKCLVVLGGGNDISYPDCAALARVAAPVLAVNVDAHFDVRADKPRNSGTPYRHLLEEGFVEPLRLHQVANQPHANSPVYTKWLRELGVQVHSLAETQRRGVAALLADILRGDPDAASVFWGLDMDAVSAADAPGVSAPNACGLSGRELCEAAAAAGHEPRTRVIEISEVSPAHDVDRRTSRLAAVAIHHYLTALAERIS